MITAPVPTRTVWPLRRDADDPLAFLTALAATDEAAVVPFRVGRREAFLLNAPTAIEDVLVRQPTVFVKGRGYERAGRLLGNGLLTASGEHHLERRRVSQGAFHRQRIDAHVPVIVSRVRHRSDVWRDGEAIDVAREMRELTLTIAGEALFGIDLDRWTDRISHAVTGALSPMDGLLAIVAPPAQARQARRELDDVLDAILESRRASTAAPHDDLLSMLLAVQVADDQSSVRQLRDDIATFLVASHDTLSHALTWTWLLLAAHPDVDERLGGELTSVLGQRAAESDDVPRLVYTRAVLAEAMRLFPPAWIIVRRATVDARLAGVDVPAGALVIASPFVMQRDVRFFEDPLRFHPERWLIDGEPRRPKLSYFPFGAGGRACIGEGFAWLEGTLVLATIAQRWRLASTSTATVEPRARVTLRPRHVPPMTLAAR